ncbi:MAG: CopG family transcriptional regulator [Bacteroidota bacterium]
MKKTIHTELPEQLVLQAMSMIQQGWIKDMDELLAVALRRYLDSHQEEIVEKFIKEDVEWGLNGED